MSSPIQPSTHFRSLRLAGALPPAPRVRPEASALAAGMFVLACGGEARDASADPAEAFGVADLALVQRVDSQDLADGDAAGFRRADQSRGLLEGRWASAPADAERSAACANDPRVNLGLVSLEACVGAELFFREAFGGNGRTCGSCHPVTHNFTIDPEFIAGLAEDDPLFVSERDPALAELEKPQLLRDFGLIRVNPDGVDDPLHKFTMRAVSHIFSLATSVVAPPVIAADGTTLDFTPTPPLERTGWSGDGAPGQGTLRDFAQGAIQQHATRSLDREPYADFMPALDAQLERMERYQRSVGRMNELDLAQVSLADPGAERGRLSYIGGPARRCNTCHSNAGANNIVTELETGATSTGNFAFAAGHEFARPSELSEQGIPIDGGFGTTPLDLNGDGVVDMLGRGTFSSHPLIEAVDNAPFFHTHAAAEIEDAIRYYSGPVFGTSPSGRLGPPGIPGGPIVLTDAEVSDVGRLLRVLNAAFNLQLALPRVQAAHQIAVAYGNRYISIQRGLLELARIEMGDALEVLGAVSDLDTDAQDLILSADRHLRRAARSLYRRERAEQARRALISLSDANQALGTGLGFVIGEGTLMF